MLLKNYKVSIFILTLLLAFNCSKDEQDQTNTNDVNNNNNNPGLNLVDQVSIGGSGDEFGIGIVPTSNGFIICGVNDQERPYLVGIDSNFEVTWEQNLGLVGVGGFEKILRTQDGNYIATGFTEKGTSELDMDLYAVKFDASGNVLWDKALGFNYVTDTTIDVVEASNGDLIIAGSKLAEPLPQNIFAATQDILVTRIDGDGNAIWSNTYGGLGKESFSSIIEENNGNILIGGSVVEVILDSNGNIDEYLPGDILIVRTDANGEVVQQETLGSPESEGSARIQKLNNGQIVVIGSSNGNGGDVTSGNSGESDVWLFTLSNSLSIINQVSLGDAGIDFAFKLLETETNNFFLVGYSNSNSASATNLFSPSDYWIQKLDNSFNPIEELFLGGSDSDIASGAIMVNNQLVVIGSSISSDGDVLDNKGSWDIWMTIIEDFN